MATPARLSELMYAVDGSSEEVQIYLHRPTGEVVSVSGEALEAAEKPAAAAGASLGWQAEEVELARRVLAGVAGEYVDLPDQCDFDEFAVMEKFVAGLTDAEAAERLARAGGGRGVFRRFKDGVRDLGLEEPWQQFRNAALREFVVEWCAGLGLEYVDDVGMA